MRLAIFNACRSFALTEFEITFSSRRTTYPRNRRTWFWLQNKRRSATTQSCFTDIEVPDLERNAAIPLEVTFLTGPAWGQFLSSIPAPGYHRMEPAEDIRRKTEACQSLFTHCLSNPLFSELEWFENRQGEFNLWAASLKAASIGRSSLDYRVRDSPEVRESICDLLDGLSETLEGLPQTGM
jgi:hypothetical protein